MNTLLSVFTTIAAAVAAGTPADGPDASQPILRAAGTAQTPFTFDVEENASVETSVGTVTFDAPNRADRIEFHLQAGNVLDAFALDRRTGRLTVHNPSALDFEARPVFELTVEVRKVESAGDALRNRFQARLRQSGVDVGAFEKPSVLARVPVIVRLQDVVEGVAVSDSRLWVREDAAEGTVLGRVQVSPGDLNRSLTFSVLAGNEYAMFDVDRRTGQVSLFDASLLSFEECSVYRLAVEVSDSSGSRAVAEVTIDVEDVNEPPTGPLRRFRIDEDADAGTELGSVSATDPDKNDVVHYELVVGSNRLPFEVDSNDGRLRVSDSAAMNYEKCPRYDLIVRAFDGAGSDVRIPVVVEVVAVDRPAVAPLPFQALEVPPVPEWAATDGPAAPATGSSDAVATSPVSENSPMLGFALLGVAVVCLGAYTASMVGSRKARGASAEERQEERSRMKARIAELESAIRQLEEQKDELVQSNGRLETERMQLNEQLQSVGEQQTQLKQECDRVLAEADAVSQMRGLLEQQRRELDAERTQLDQLRRDLQEEHGCLRGMLSGDDDLDDEDADDSGANERFEFDDEPEAGGQPVSTHSGGSDSALSTAVDDSRLDDLRSNLSNAFGLSYSGSAKTTAPAEPQFEAAAATTVAVEDGTAPEAQETDEPQQDDGCETDSVAAYMQALLNRTRQNRDSDSPQQFSTQRTSAATAKSTPTVTPAVQSTTVTRKNVVSETTKTDETETPAEPAPVRPRPTINKDAVRQDLNSLRQVANLDARSALSKHALKRRKRRMVVAGTLGTVSLVAAAILLPTDWWGGASVASYGWVAAGVAVLMAVEFCRLLRLKYQVHGGQSGARAADADDPNGEDPNA